MEDLGVRFHSHVLGKDLLQTPQSRAESIIEATRNS